MKSRAIRSGYSKHHYAIRSVPCHIIIMDMKATTKKLKKVVIHHERPQMSSVYVPTV